MSNDNSKNNNIKQLMKLYRIKKAEIIKRLEDFKNIWDKNDNKIFAELCFCILTPQSKAKACNEIINKLERNKLLLEGKLNDIKPYLKKARFYKNKSRYIIDARKFFHDKGKIKIKNRLNINDIITTREWLVKNIKGIGYKEASHFLRNIGFGQNIAILDVHILSNLMKFGLIKRIPRPITKKTYLEIENKVKEFSDKINIPISHLDLLFWNRETGGIFK